jgi:hypothetical protein
MSSTAGAARYLVTGLDKDELRKHLNHQVEIQGRLDAGSHSGTSGHGTSGSGTSGTESTRPGGGTSSSGATSGAGSTAGSSGSTGTSPGSGTAGQSTGQGATAQSGTSRSGAMGDLPKLEASSIRMISSSCTPSGSPQ